MESRLKVNWKGKEGTLFWSFEDEFKYHITVNLLRVELDETEKLELESFIFDQELAMSIGGI